MREVYTALEAKIRAELKPELPALGDVERFFNQVARAAAGTGKPIVFPAVYFELVNIRTASRGGGIQDCDGVLRLRLCDQAMIVQQLRTPKMEELVYFGLTGWQGATLMTGLERIAVYPDSTFVGVETIVQEWAIKWTDTTLKDRRTDTIPASTVARATAFKI